MVGKVVPKQRLGNSLPPPLASKAAVVPRRAVESTKKKEGVGLADLRDVDKAKVARLINHVMMAFKEIQRLKELLEQERSAQEALVNKLQQQNHEVAAEVSQLRLKLASLQLLSPLPSQKVYLHPGRRPSLSPIREAECSEVESDPTRSPVPDSNGETTSILTEREIHSGDSTTAPGGQDDEAFNRSEGKQENDESSQMGDYQTPYSQARNVAESGGKENKDPELPPQCTGDIRLANEDPAVLRRRPPPRPLPDLLSNILHRCRDAADQSDSSIKYVSKRDAFNGVVPIIQGNVKPNISQSLPHLTRASNSQGVDDLSTGLCGDRLGCISGVPSSRAAMPPFASSVGLKGHDCTTPLEPEGRELLGTENIEGGRQHEARTYVVHAPSKRTAFHPCSPNCLQRLSSNLSNLPCPEQSGGAEKVYTATCNYEDLTEPTTCTSQKKLRFDPTAGEEGIFYYESDIEENAEESLEVAPLLRVGPEERPGVQVRGKTEPPSLSTSSVEGQRPNRDTLDNRWTPEAIERRNSFHRIPVVSPRSTNGNDRRRFFSDGFTTKTTENEAGRGVSHAEEPVQLTASDCEAGSIRNEKLNSSKSRPSPYRASTCMNCSSIVLRKSKRPSFPSKLSTKFRQRCSKCSSIFEPKAAAHLLGAHDAHTGRITRSGKRCSKSKPSRHNLRSSIEKSGSGSEGGLTVTDESTPSSSKNVARCGKRTSRPKFTPLLSPQQKPRRGQVGSRTSFKVEEVSDPASIVYRLASEDMYMSTPSSTDYSMKTGRHVPCFPLKSCRIHTQKMTNKRGRVREVNSVKVLGDHRSEPTEVFHVNRKILKMLVNSDLKSRDQLKNPLADSTECRIETWRFGKSHNSPEELAEEGVEQASRVSCGNLDRHRLLDKDLNPRRGLTLSSDGCRQARKQGSEKWKNFKVDDLLDKFIQSNAECAAELVKCSVYFESTSTSSRLSSQSTHAGLNPSEEKLSFQNATAPEKGTESSIAATESVQPSEKFGVVHNGFSSAKKVPEGSVPCSKCGVCLNSVPPVDAIGMVETKGFKDLCDTCSASVTPEKVKAVQKPDEITQPADIAPPIVLPRGNSDDPRNLHEAGRQQKSLIPQNSTVKRSWELASKTVHDPPDPFSEEYQMPILAGVAINTRRLTPLSEKEAETAEELRERFDMSLFDLVNDLEEQRRDYWKRINCHSLDDGRKTAVDGNRRRTVDVETVQKSVRRTVSSKQVQVNHFR